MLVHDDEEEEEAKAPSSCMTERVGREVVRGRGGIG